MSVNDQLKRKANAEILAIHHAVMNPMEVEHEDGDTYTVSRVKEFIRRAVGKYPGPSSGAQCSACGFQYFAHNGHIIPCPRCENERLVKLIDTPELEDFDTGVPLESAHQVKRWGEAHDRSKSAENWYWLVGYLAGKALRASITGDREKALHHTISTAAALRNWHRAIQQDSTGAGIGQDDDLAALASPSPNGNVEKKP